VVTYVWSLIILCIVLIGQIFAIDGLYISIPLIDVPLHVLGSIGIGLFISALITSSALRLKSRRLGIMIGVLVIGIIWETMEAYYNISGYMPGTKLYYFNVTRDLLNDIIGGGIAIWFVRNKN